jgi:hypothetical protein
MRAVVDGRDQCRSSRRACSGDGRLPRTISQIISGKVSAPISSWIG